MTLSDVLTQILIPAAAVVGIAFALFQWLIVSKVKLSPEPHGSSTKKNGGHVDSLLEEEEGVSDHGVVAKCAEIQSAISEGATAFLFTEYQYVGIFMVAFAVLIFLFLGSVEGFSTKGQPCTYSKDKICKPALFNAIFSTIAFVLGAITSVISGFLGMKIATYANARTTLEARKGVGKAFIVAFRSGAVMGFSLAANGLLVLYISINLFKLYYGDDWEGLFEAITGYGLGGSSMALFGRVGGGIYTKAADVGADLVGKVEMNIPEDDPRNPAVIADNVGDNVGDIAGMGSDLFGSYAESSCAALVVASISSFGINHDFTPPHCLSQLCLSTPNPVLNPSPSPLQFKPCSKTPMTHLKKSTLHNATSCRSLRLKSKNLYMVTETREGEAGAAAAAERSGLVDELVYEALVWSSLHGLVVGDRNVQRSGVVPGVGMVHAPIALLPMPFPENYWSQACELAPIFNELVDRVSLDGKFLQDSLSRTKKVDAFTSRLLDIHAKMLEINKQEDIRLGLHRSDYMLDAETNQLFQVELNTISTSSLGLGCLVSELHRNLLDHYGKHLGLDSRKVPGNLTVSQFAVALANAWNAYNNSSAIVLVVVQPEERNMYDQHWLCSKLKESHGIASIRKTLAEINAEGEVLPDGSFLIGGKMVAVVYFRAGYAPNDYPSESEWRARFLIEKSNAIKCPSISYHLVGTKKIQQELAKPNVLERFLENKDDVAKLRKCFAGLWGLDNPEGVKGAMERPELFVLKPQREGGGNNIYGEDVRKTLVRLQQEGSEEQAAYILMQRIFPRASKAYLVREGLCHQDQVISEFGIFGAYLRNKDKVVMNEPCGYLMRTKISSADEGGVIAGFAVLDSVYLT